MAFNTPAILLRLETVLKGLASIPTLSDGGKAVYIGSPTAAKAGLSTYIMVADQRAPDKAGGLVRRDAAVLVKFAYRTDGDVRAAELAIAALIDQFTTAFYAERRSDMGGVVASCAIDLSANRTALYELIGGTEHRVYLVLITATQQQNV